MVGIPVTRFTIFPGTLWASHLAFLELSSSHLYLGKESALPFYTILKSDIGMGL